MESHDAAVRLIAERVRHFSSQQKPFRIYHGSTNSTRTSQRRPDNTVDTSALTRVLSVDAASRTALVEPNVPMDALVEATLAHGLVPPVVMEFPGITAGGGFSGMAGESSSFRHGAFDATMRSVEMVLPTGEVARASRTERPELFWGAASAFGTLGVVTLLEIELREARRYVALSYALTRSSRDTLAAMEEAEAAAETDYIDGIVFAKDATVVCVGRLTDDLPEGKSPRRFSRRTDPWFYLRVRNVLRQLQQKPTEAVVDYIPLRDYLFRYDRGGFWVGRYAFRYFLTPFNRVTRCALDRFMHARVMYRAVHRSGLADTHMVQDVGVPYAAVPDFSAWLDAQFGIYPLWLCPLRVQRDAPDAQHGLHSEFGRPGAPKLMNFGVWGELRGARTRREVVGRNRELERKVQALGGKKWLYAHAYYPEDEFWAHYDRESYDKLRERYGAGYLPSVYDKVKVDVEAEEAAARATWRSRARHGVKEIWPVRGVVGFCKAAVGGDYLLQKSRGKTEEDAASASRTP
ncbi:FAD binding domain protein [Cordyceps fumosorosea ARSEF 2679]|uniref:Delta(24)-sterol reductase n=1 Tax=Cordyceps fumosorosea (strain ARSEF 2679) TaxID=1081104 RepID=A0A168DAR2_CORFA|nr:FAD binding domain protein [Cordyceps fumosorosea ARSEF 2679]OAA72370.1 FAD binding domain protein [Cordyceps fumosorosea ARSEF 2679]